MKRSVESVFGLPGRWLAGYGAASFLMYLSGGLYTELWYDVPPGTAWLHALARAVTVGGMWTANLAAVLFITRRVRSPSPRNLAIAFVAGMLAVNVIATVQDLVTCTFWTWVPCGIGPLWFTGRFGQLPILTMIVTTALIFGVGAKAAERAQQDRQRAERLAAELARTRMAVLDLQLRPHFLFNTLQSIATLVHVDVPAARDMLSRLSQLLRESAARDGEQVVPLRRELHMLRLYTAIEAVRFGPRLVVAVDADDDALDVAVPHLLLQPLVENAIRHAIAEVGQGSVWISARLTDGARRLALEVRDDGPGLPEGWTAPRDRVGLANTRERLDALYGPRAGFSLSNDPGGGLRVAMEIPVDERLTEG